jgi:hypothetical protein
MRRAGYSWLQRTLRVAVVGRTLAWFLTAYLLLDAAAVLAEGLCHSYLHSYLPGWTATEFKGLLKDITSYFIAAQVTLLGIIAVAVAIVTLISQHKTDVRLYYVESLVNELVLSGVSLLIVLCVQLLWPLQFAAHRLGFGGPDLVFKFTLTGVHLTWLVVNFTVFVQFVITTLHFVEPRARERLRERYTANIITPRDLSVRLCRVFYINMPKQLVPGQEGSMAPAVTFGFDLSHDGLTEVASHFGRPSVLRDVRLKPLGWVLRSWLRRTEVDRREPAGPGFPMLGQDIRLAFPASFDGVYEGDKTWCQRKGGAALRRRDRWLIRRSFRFATAHDEDSDLPTPANFLEELAERVIGQIELAAVTGFKSALDEMIRYHRFVLDIHDTRSAEGQPMSLAEVGGFWEAPYEEWIRHYRRVFAKAADKIRDDTSFFNRLAHAAFQLLPSDASGKSPAVVTSLLDLALHEVVMLEAWVTRRTTVDVPEGDVAQPRLGLAGSDRRAYDEVVRAFIGAWEDVLRISEPLYYRADRDGDARQDHWNALARWWAFLERHMRNTAYFLASAVWNEDAIGADRYRDTLLRWIGTARPTAEPDYQIEHRALLIPDTLSLEWQQVEARLVPRGSTFWRGTPSPRAVFGLVVQGAFDDVIILAAAIILGWHMHNQLSTDIDAQTAARLVARQVIEGEGAHFPTDNGPPQTIFRSLFSLIVREALKTGEYGSALDGLVRFLNGMSERRLVPGRHYISSGSDGLDALRPQLLAMMAAHLPPQGDDGALDWVREIAAREELFPDGDLSLRRLVWSFEAYARALDEALQLEPFERGVRVFAVDADIAAIRSRLQAILSMAMTIIQQHRTQRLRARPIDPAKLNALVVQLTDALSPELACFSEYSTHNKLIHGNIVTVWQFGIIDKAMLVDPVMSDQNLDEVIRITSNAFRQHLAEHVWYEFWQQARDAIEIDASNYPHGYWTTVLAQAEKMGPHTALLVPYRRIGDSIARWQYDQAQRPDYLEIQRLDRKPSGGGTSYVATVNGFDVFTAQIDENHSYLFSQHKLKSIIYRQVAPDKFVTVDFEEGDDPSRGRVAIRFSQEVRWRAARPIQFVLTAPA